MNDFLKYVSPGDPIDGIQTETFNCMIDAARAVRDRGTGFREISPKVSETATRIMVENATGEDCDEFAVLGIDGFLFEAANAADRQRQNLESGILLKGVKPVAGKPFAILREPLRSGNVGRAVMAGVVPCKVYVKKAYHFFAEPVANITGYLQSSLAGPVRILPGGTALGEQWRYAHLGAGWAAASYSGVLATALTAGTEKSATVTVTFTGTANTETVTAYTYPGLTVKAVAVGKAVRIVFDPLAQKWYFDKLDC